MTTMISRPATAVPPPFVPAPDASNSSSLPPRVTTSGGLTSPAATPHPMPIPGSPQGPTSGRQSSSDAQCVSAAGTTSPAATSARTPMISAPQGTTTTGGHQAPDTRRGVAAGSDAPGPVANEEATTTGGTLLDPALSLAADILDDLERVRIANENRLRQLTRTETDADGLERGFGLDESHPDVARLAAMVETLAKVEHDATLNLQRKLRKHPLGAWVKAQKGVGEKQGARLLAAIGDPYINSAKGTPRTVSALWAYSGLHVLPVGQATGAAQPDAADRSQLPANHRCLDAHGGFVGGDQHRDTDQSSPGAQRAPVGVAAKRRKGERANWSGNAKMRAHLVAESCIKQLRSPCHAAAYNGRWLAVHYGECTCSPYRVVYDSRRMHTAATHPEWTDGHSHNDALRVASKAILRDLWRAARDWHLANGAKS